MPSPTRRPTSWRCSRRRSPRRRNDAADTFFGGSVSSGFTAVVDRIAQLAQDFGKPVLLLQGDTHRFLVDRPIASAPNVTRVVVEGETIAEWLRLEIDPDGPRVFTFAREGVG